MERDRGRENKIYNGERKEGGEEAGGVRVMEGRDKNKEKRTKR